MDSINPDSHFQFIARREAQSPPSSGQGSRPQASDIDAPAKTASPILKPAYSNMFDDSELELLQNNLQSIADMAGQALKDIEK